MHEFNTWTGNLNSCTHLVSICVVRLLISTSVGHLMLQYGHISSFISDINAKYLGNGRIQYLNLYSCRVITYHVSSDIELEFGQCSHTCHPFPKLHGSMLLC